MNARIEKKLSKKVLKYAPKLFHRYWIDKEVSEAAENQGTRVSHVPMIGGDYCSWSGDCNDAYTLWEHFRMNFEWYGDFEQHPKGHEFEGYPNIKGFKVTTVNLLRLARRIGV